MHAVIISEKRSHEVEGKQGGVYGRIWREEIEGENVVILF